MDVLDLKIIRYLLLDANISYIKLAEMFDIDKQTLKTRIDNLFDIKILSEPFVELDRECFKANLGFIILKFKSVDDKNDGLKQISEKSEDFYYEMIVNDSAEGLCILFVYNTKNDLETISKKYSDMNNVKESRLYTFAYPKRTSPDLEITSVDWKIIRELIENLHLDPKEVAKRLDITPRKLNNRIEYLTKNKIIHYNINFYNTNASDSITLFLIINIDHYSSTLETILMNKLNTEHISYYAFKDQSTLIFGLNIDDIKNYYKVEEKIKKIKDVIGIKKIIWSDVLYSNSWSKKFVYSKLMKLSGKKS